MKCMDKTVIDKKNNIGITMFQVVFILIIIAFTFVCYSLMSEKLNYSYSYLDEYEDDYKAYEIVNYVDKTNHYSENFTRKTLISIACMSFSIVCITSLLFITNISKKYLLIKKYYTLESDPYDYMKKNYFKFEYNFEKYQMYNEIEHYNGKNLNELLLVNGYKSDKFREVSKEILCWEKDSNFMNSINPMENLDVQKNSFYEEVRISELAEMIVIIIEEMNQIDKQIIFKFDRNVKKVIIKKKIVFHLLLNLIMKSFENSTMILNINLFYEKGNLILEIESDGPIFVKKYSRIFKYVDAYCNGKINISKDKYEMKMEIPTIISEEMLKNDIHYAILEDKKNQSSDDKFYIGNILIFDESVTLYKMLCNVAYELENTVVRNIDRMEKVDKLISADISFIDVNLIKSEQAEREVRNSKNSFVVAIIDEETTTNLEKLNRIGARAYIVKPCSRVKLNEIFTYYEIYKQVNSK